MLYTVHVKGRDTQLDMRLYIRSKAHPAASAQSLEDRVEAQAEALYEVLQHVAQRPAWDGRTIFAGKKLRRTAELCKGKAAGCDT